MAVPVEMRVLHGAGVTLEPQLASHAAELYAVLKDPDLYQFIDRKEPASEDALRERLARLETRKSADGTQDWLNWVIRNDAGQVVGYVQATVDQGDAEIAYVLGKAHWRRGYASAACAAMIDELRDAYGAVRLTATLDPANAASLGMLSKLGFKRAWEDLASNEVGYSRNAGP